MLTGNGTLLVPRTWGLWHKERGCAVSLASISTPSAAKRACRRPPCSAKADGSCPFPSFDPQTLGMCPDAALRAAHHHCRPRGRPRGESRRVGGMRGRGERATGCSGGSGGGKARRNPPLVGIRSCAHSCWRSSRRGGVELMKRASGGVERIWRVEDGVVASIGGAGGSLRTTSTP
ncbi:hypothetical protein DMC30DRAFT_278823 [Rhodotorula diobovata]|uniref:Uncharacterized protein n=1 Tax=Rhodotorula diobovata TaxID=5288 RepID=A0A5C5G5K2_9BASI|nr:hypothetical protein DMC30DRAFT_278823 [Rhodotorula diobovata]